MVALQSSLVVRTACNRQILDLRTARVGVAHGGLLRGANMDGSKREGIPAIRISFSKGLSMIYVVITDGQTYEIYDSSQCTEAERERKYPGWATVGTGTSRKEAESLIESDRARHRMISN